MRASRFSALAVPLAVLSLAACGPEADRPDSEGGDALAVAAAAATTPQASLSEEEREELRQLARGYLDRVESDLTEGYAPVDAAGDEVVALQPAQTHNWRISLKGGETYRIAGACDNECQNMDFHLLDPSGEVVQADTLDDSFPVLNFTPGADGEYTVRFTMTTCTIAPCFAAGRLYRRS